MPDRSKTISPKMASRLKGLRIKKRLTQKELAKKLYKSESTVRMWELGKSEPDVETLIDLSNILGAPTDFILGRDFEIRLNQDFWSKEMCEKFELAEEPLKDLLLFEFGRGYFPTPMTQNGYQMFFRNGKQDTVSENTAEPIFLLFDLIDEGTLMYRHGGELREKQLSSTQMDAIVPMLDALPDKNGEI